LDPFSGTGTTLLEGKKLGLNVIGFEANPICHFASNTKIDWNIDIENLEKQIKYTQAKYRKFISSDRVLPNLSEKQHKLLIGNSISEPILRKCLLIKQIILRDRASSSIKRLELLGVARTAMNLSNLRFAPEVGVKDESKWILDADVIKAWKENVSKMCDDLSKLKETNNPTSGLSLLVDSRRAPRSVGKQSVDFLFTSPPYPNEKDYTRITRLELVLLDFLKSPKQLYALKKNLICSNTRAIHTDDDDGDEIQHLSEITTIAEQIEQRRIEKNGVTNFELLFHKVVLHFFGGMRLHLQEMKKLMKPGALMGYVVGDQASFFRVPIRTGELFAVVAKDVGLEVVRIDLFRERHASITKTKLREEVVILRNPVNK